MDLIQSLAQPLVVVVVAEVRYYSVYSAYTIYQPTCPATQTWPCSTAGHQPNTAVSLWTQNNAYTQSTSWSDDYKQCLGSEGRAVTLSGDGVTPGDIGLGCAAITTYSRW